MSLRRLIAVLGAALATCISAGAHAGELARGDVAIVGTGLEVDRNPVSAATGVPSFVQTIFGGRTGDDAPAALGLTALGDLTGPGIDAPITLSTIPGKTFAIPALHVKGEYVLQNIRLAGANGEFLQQALPSFAQINVTDALKTDVRVRQLTAAELRERGILVDARNYDVYEYTVVFTVNGAEVQIPYPVIIDKVSRALVPIGPGAQSPPPLPPNAGRPRFVPAPPKLFDIGTIGDMPEPADDREREAQLAPPRLPAALVVPTGFGVLHQFFAVILQVSNGSDDATVKLDSITASMRAPLQMRVSKVTPAVAVGQPVPITDETTGATFLVAGAQGSAEWTLEALKTGTHTLDLEVRATYQKPGQADFPMSGRVSTSIVVSDPRFQVTFSHPDTVRADERYTAYAFITNLSEQRQHVMLDMSEIPPCSGGALNNICRTEGEGTRELDLEAGEMVPVPYKLLSKVTGKVFAAAGSANDETVGVSVKLSMGVSTSGIPLSPATLLMPHYAQFLPAELVESNLQLLGLGYSLAVAPLNKFTARHPRIITTDVFTRAQEIARAGQRIFVARAQRDVGVAEEDRDAMIHLSLDLLDNVERVDQLARIPPLEEWDQLRRNEEAGRRAGAAMARQLERTARGTPAEFVDDFAEAVSHRTPFLLAYVHGPPVAGSERPYALSVTGRTTGAAMDVVSEAAGGWVRDLAGGELTKLELSGEAGELALVGRWREDYRIAVRPAASSFTLHLLYPDTADGKLLRADIAVSGATPGVPVLIELLRGTRVIVVQNGSASPLIAEVAQTPLRLLGAAQDLHLDAAGHVVTLLFNRPTTVPEGEKWRDRLALTIEVAKASYTAVRRNNPADPAAELQIPAANEQEDGRMVHVTFDKSLSKNAAYEIEVAHDATFHVVPRVDNDRPGAILTGKVLLPDNSPAEGAFVSLVLPDVRAVGGIGAFEGLVQGDVTGADGRFLFEYVPRDPARGYYGNYQLAARTRDGKTTSVVGAVRLPGEVHTVNLTFYGRGRVRGQVRYNDGEPIANRHVSASSPLHGEPFNAWSDAGGNYEMEVGVGPLTFVVTDRDGRMTFASNQLRNAGEVITQDLVIAREAVGGTGTVRLTVRRIDTNEPLPNAIVTWGFNGYTATHNTWTDANGQYTFYRVPAGVVTLLAEHNSVATGVEVDLEPDQILEHTLFLDVRNVAEYATLEGVVMRDDPAAPNDTSKDQPVPNAIIAIYRYGRITANADGSFRWPDIPVGKSGEQVTVYDPATGRKLFTHLPTLTADATVRFPLRFSTTATPKGTMRVRLYNAQNQPVGNYRVLSPGYPPFDFPEGSPGVYEVADVSVPQRSQVVAIPRAASAYGDQYASGSVGVDFDGQIGVTDLRLPGAGTIAAKILVEQSCGTPPCYSQALGRVAVTYMIWDPFTQGPQPKTIELETDAATGVATFPNIPARQNVFVSTAGHPLGHAQQTVFLTHDGDARAVSLVLSDMAEVTGYVFAHDGITPVSGASVRIKVATASYDTKVTGADGAFRFTGLASGLDFELIAELTRDGLYRTGVVYGRTPANGGPLANLRIVLREQSSIEGRVVDRDGNPVPLAHYWLRELAWPYRELGNPLDPLKADINGRFILGNVFTGPFRITAVSADNQELRGDYQGTLAEEGDASHRNVEVPIGLEGVGTVAITVRDPLLGFEPVENAEVALYRGGGQFDFTTTNENGVAVFEQVPGGSPYSVRAYSKARLRGGNSAEFAVTADQTTSVEVPLDFRGAVSGTLVDPDGDPANAPVPDQPVTVTGQLTAATSYEMRDSTDASGAFEIVGLPEGAFRIYGYEMGTQRVAFGPEGLSISKLVPEHRDIRLELERYATLTVKVHLPDDSGGPGELAPLAEVWARTDDGQYSRAFQGNPIAFEKMTHRRPYFLDVKELGGEGRTMQVPGSFPAGVYAHEQVVVLPASGNVEVLVVDGANVPIVDAFVKIQGSNRSWEGFTSSAGLFAMHGVPFGRVSASALKGNLTAAASGELLSRSTPLRLTLSLGTNVTLTGTVEAETPENTPSAGTRVLANVSASVLTGPLRLETRTDANGAYAFRGIPVGGTHVELLFYSSEDRQGGVRNIGIPDGTSGTYAVGNVRLDATPPRVMAIDPPANSTNVSPATQVTVTFSEQLAAASLDAQFFQWHSTDDSQPVRFTLQTSVRPDQTFVVTLIPNAPPDGQTFPLKSNVLYRFAVSSQIKDLSGHALAAPAGTSFTTVHYVEPDIARIEPTEQEALVEGQTFRIKFNKPIDLTSFDPGQGGIVTLDRLDAYRGNIVEALAVARSLDPADPSMLVVAPQGTAIAESSFYRLTVAGVRDLASPPNTMRETRIFEFFSFDRVTPVARIVSPVADGEKLVAGVLYEATVAVTDGGTEESKDVAYVDWLDANGASIARAKTKPWGYTFVAPSDAAAFTLKASATDLSFNSSEVASFTWDVAPNEPPRDIVVTNTPASAYPGAKIATRVAFQDEGLAVTVALELRGTNLDGTPYSALLGSKKITRPSTAETFAEAAFEWTLPLELKDGTATVVATATDSVNKSGTGDGAMAVLADTAAPRLVSMAPAAETRYAYGTTYTIELKVQDAETGVARAMFTVAGTEVFSGAGTYDAATGVTTFAHTATVPPKNADTRVTIVATAYDHRHNAFSETREVIYERVDDATLPVAAWITPLDGAALPSNQSGWLTTLRVRAADDVKVTSVRFESSALAAAVTVTEPKSGTTDVFETKAALTMPADGSSFEIKAIVADGDPAHDVELPIVVDPVAVDATITSDVAISSITAAHYADKSVLVRGNAKVYVSVPLRLTDLILVDGATLSNPEETPLDLDIAGRFFVDGDSSIDLTAKGYVGGLRSSEGSAVVNASRNGRAPDGATVVNADGSHAGIGGSGSGLTNGTYGDASAPAAFGAGGAAEPEGGSDKPGANGGGAARIDGDRLVVAGALRADGGSTGANYWAAGAGGSVDLHARVLITGAATRITANGGDGPSVNDVDRGGGGGRIALHTTDRLDLGEDVLHARGGRNGAATGVGGGAGTVWVNGALTVSSYDERHPSSAHLTMGTPLAGTFDSIVIGPRALARFDGAPPAGMTVDATALVVTPDDAPSIELVSTTPAANANVPQATSIAAMTTGSSVAGIRELRTILSVQPNDATAYPKFVTAMPETATSIAIPATATAGAATLTLRITDRAGRIAASAPVTFTIVENTAPVIDAMTVTPETETYAGRTIAVTASASDDVEVTSLALTSSSGTITSDAATKPAPTTMTRTFSVAIPPATPGESEVTLTLAASDGFPSRAATTRTHTVRVLADSGNPSVSIVAPLANEELQEGSGATFVVEVNAADAEVAVQRVTAMFEGTEHELTAIGNGVYRKTLDVPSVEGSEPVAKTLVVTAFDYAGNSADASRTIFVKPLLDPNAPALQWVCASPGAMAPPGYELTLRISAVPSSATNGVDRVEFAIGDHAPVAAASIGSNVYETKFTIPVGTADGTRFDVRVLARSVAGNEATLLGHVTAVTGTDIATSSTITADDTAFEGLSVIVRSGGTLIVHGTHALKNIVVLDGGKLVQRHADLARADRLTAERVFVACGGSIDVSGLGYAKNTSAPGAGVPDNESGGSRIGRGGVVSHASGGAFGSVTRPREAGGGGHVTRPTSDPRAGQGGGAIRIHANTAMAVDGHVLATGIGSTILGSGGGAGGSVWLTTDGALSGAGLVDARGGNSNNDRAPGGGGAVAIEYGSASGTLLTRVGVQGGWSGWGNHGGSGTLYTRGGSSAYGDLALHNQGMTSKWTSSELPSLGRMRVASVASNAATLDGVRWIAPSFEGHRVRAFAPDGTVRGTYRVAAIANDAGVVHVNGFAEIQTQDAIAYDGHVVYSPLGINGRNFVAARWANERWEYDSGSIFTAFNPRPGEAIVASFSKDSSAITALRTYRLPASDIHGLPVVELFTGELLANVAAGQASDGTQYHYGALDDAELFLRPDSAGRAVVLSRGLDAAIELVADDGSAVDVSAGDTLHGIYLFDSVTLTSAVVVTDDLLESTSTPVVDAASSLATGNRSAPTLDASNATIERGLYGPVLAGPADAAGDADSPVDVIARAASHTPATPSFDRNWQMFAGTRGGLSLSRRPVDRPAPYGISTLDTIGGSGFVTFTASQTSQAIQAGLAPADTTRALEEPGIHAFRLRADGRYEVWANGAYANKHFPYTTATVFRIEKTPSRVRFYADGVRVHEVIGAIPPLRFDVSTSSESAELHSIEFNTSGDGGRFRAAANADGSFRVPVRAAAGERILLAARDRHRVPIESAEAEAVTMPSDIGIAAVAFDPAELTGGRTSTATVTLQAAAGSEGALIELSSDRASAAVPPSVTIAAGATTGTFTVTTTAVADTVDATITAAYGGNGASATLRLLKDTIAPAVTVTSPAANSSYTEGQTAKIDVRATVSDADSGVKRVWATVDGADYPMTPASGVWSAQVPVPFVDGTTDVERSVAVNGEDNNGNIGSGSVTIVVHPVVDPNPPAISIACGSDGAGYPARYAARFRYVARGPAANNPIQKVEVTITDPNGVATTTTAAAVSGVADAYEIVFTIPDLADGSVFTVSGVATATSGTTATVTSQFRVVKGASEIRANLTIAATDTTYDGRTVVIFPGVTVTIDGAHAFERLYVLGTLVPALGKTLDVTANTFFVACGASVDATSRGYTPRNTYPGARNVQVVQEAGAHIGRGGVIVQNAGSAQIGATYGSITTPREFGAGDYRNATGGGAIRVDAANVVVDGAIRANGGNSGEGAAAGGSIWISASKIAGAGPVEADGGNGCWAGGGGAVAIHYTDAASLVPALNARPGINNCGNTYYGGPGTVFVKGPSSTFGDASVDTGGRGAAGIIDLPALGSGFALAGSSGATLVTDRAADIPPYFASHWVRVTASDGTVRGTWPVASIGGRTVTLDGASGIAEGDAWQGVYRFDALALRDAEVTSGDLIEAASQTLHGTITASRIRGIDAVVKSNAIVTHGAGSSLDIRLAGALTVESGAAIDVSSRGYKTLNTYPGARNVTIVQQAGSHIGRGADMNLSGATYGSITRPSEAGAGDYRNAYGGGIVRIDSAAFALDGTIRANGGNSGGEGAGAGGSVWITTGAISGSGAIEADGGRGCWAGGGGALSLTWTSGTLPALAARGGIRNCSPIGGAGSVYLFGPGAARGNATFDNADRGLGTVELPTLGAGTAQSGTAGDTLVTARATDVPAYFVGHEVAITAADGTPKGTWPIASVSGRTVILDGASGLEAGDLWRGVYRFDTLKLRATTLRTGDRIVYDTLDKDAASTLVVNDAPPRFTDPSLIALTNGPNGSAVTAPANAVADTDTPIKLTATNARTAQTFTGNAGSDGSIYVAVTGAEGDTFTLAATDSHAEALSADPVAVSGAIVDMNSVESLTVSPSSVTSGATAYGTVRLAATAQLATTVTLSSSDASASVPASVTIAAGSASAQFAIATSGSGSATLTATYNGTATATIAVTAEANAVTALAVDPSSVEGGASANGLVTLGAAAPAGGAVVSLVSADSSLAAVPATVLVPEGATTAAFTITTSAVAAESSVSISASWGTTRTAALALTACSTMGTAAPVATMPSTVWFDDAAPAGSTSSGTGATFDGTQAASGTKSLHFRAATGARDIAFSGATALTVGPDDELVIHALTNPCNPPRQIAVTWSGTTSVTASWGENFINPGTEKANFVLPAAGAWTRLAIPARAIGITTSTSFTGLTIRVYGGEAWLDLGGKDACTLGTAAAPQRHPAEMVWFDETLPAGATSTSNTVTTQAASGATSHSVPVQSGAHSQTISGAAEKLNVAPGDVLYTYVLVDPCNPPREIMLQFHDGTGWEHRAYWGDDLVAAGTVAARARMGSVPRGGEWVRLEVPASAIDLDNLSVGGVTFTLYDGAAWFDVVGKMPRVNVALGKPARQSSTPDARFPAAKAVDGNTDGLASNLSINHTSSESQPWWETDLGAVQPIDTVQIWNRTDCCGGRLRQFWLFLSDRPIAATTVAGARAEAGVRAYSYPVAAGVVTDFRVRASARYVRVQLATTEPLHMAEVQVWAPPSKASTNFAGGTTAVSQSSDSSGGTAERAVNGNVNGDWHSELSVTHTGANANAWWQIDLGRVQPISTIDLGNRRDCCGERLQNFYVFVSDSAMPAAFADTLAATSVGRWYRGTGIAAGHTIDVNRTGRYVRIQLNGTNYLSLAEVQIWSRELILDGLAKRVADE